MTMPWRPLVAAAALSVTVGAGTASAQRVTIRNAPAGETIEVALNAETVGSATADAEGGATLPIDLNARLKKTDIDANVFVDACDRRHRVIVVERGQAIAPQEPGCERREVAGLFLVRAIHTLVVDVSGTNPTLMLVKGSYRAGPVHRWSTPATGLILSGGGGLLKFSDMAVFACGDAAQCTTKDSRPAFTAGGAYWLNRFMGGEFSYIQSEKLTVAGSGGNAFTFTNTIEPQLMTISGLAGVPAGPVRFYGKVGGNYHRVTSTTTETIGSATQTFQFKSRAWNWAWGVGGDVWMSGSFALYGELNFAGVKGVADEGDTGAIDDHARAIVIGARFRVGL